jgi:hypothetical protein
LRRRAAIIITVALAMFGGGVAGATALTQTMQPGDSLAVSCPNALTIGNQNRNDATLFCAPNTTTSPPTTTTPPPPGTRCPQFLTAPNATQAFCDPMNTNQGSSATSRTGTLNPVLWGVSRWTGNTNDGQGMYFDWADSTQNQCGSSKQVSNLDDVNTCGGMTVESQNDDGVITDLAMYPRQPFNFAGRTGTVEFNVSDNSESSHAAWPTMVITDQPVPAPWSDTAISDTGQHARNSIGVDLVGNGTSSPHCITGMIWSTSNYQPSAPQGSDGCALASTSVGQMNHVEVQVNSSRVTVYMSDAGTENMHQIAQASFPVPLSQGLVWLSDVHYNGDKFGNQQTDTFGWNDLAFDGPVEPRDLGFDVLDNTLPGGTAQSGAPMTNIGYHINLTCCYTSGTTLNLMTATGPTAAQIQAASGAIIVADVETGGSLQYTVNGHVNSAVAPSSTDVALPVPLSEVVPGKNQISLSFPDGASGDVANVDLILQGAGGVVQPS